MVDSQRLLHDLTRLLGTLEEDLREQVEAKPAVRVGLEQDYAAARKVGRTRDTFETWSEEPITQAAVAWTLGTVFVRFLEDNELVVPLLSGVGARHTRALQEHQHYFHQHPTHSERDYLEWVFKQLAEVPATAALFDPRHNPLWRLPLSADAARAVVEFWQQIEPDAGRVAHDFVDEGLDTRFLGDLYQDLSAPVRARYALLQTPRFVAAFILDRTLTPAIETFGYREVRLVDPTCGSGHFLLDAFDRLLALGQEHEPGRDTRVLVQDVLARVVGVDINPYAVAIAKFRLTVAALRACKISSLTDAPGFEISVAAADALLHGPRFADDGAVQMGMLPDDPANQYYFAEDGARVKSLLGQQYHAVVGNPPYITVGDTALNALYRQRYGSCHRQYSLVVPFVERFFDLGLSPEATDQGRSGYVGLIVSNSFMKREFGKKLVEEYFSKWDLTHVVDSSGAYIPGHGTPTAILFGRHRRPETDWVRAVMGIRGEPCTPDNPSEGLVWRAIVDQLDRPGSESAYVSATDVERSSFFRHPWNMGGGGAAGLKDLIDSRAELTLEQVVDEIGFSAVTREDDVFSVGIDTIGRRGISRDQAKILVEGEQIRDWSIIGPTSAIWPYGGDDLAAVDSQPVVKFLWPWKAQLSRRVAYGLSQIARGLQWFEYSMFFRARYRNPQSITFAAVASHNHFVLDRGGKVFKQSAPVIKLADGAGEDDHMALLGILNSSVACFWMKQVFYPKASSSGDISLEKGRPEANRYDFAATGLLPFPLPVGPRSESFGLARRAATKLSALAEDVAALETWPLEGMSMSAQKISKAMEEAVLGQARLEGQMVALQEELDWEIYRLFGLTQHGGDSSVIDAPVAVKAEWRPFAWESDEPPPGASVPSVYAARRKELLEPGSIALLETAVNKRLWLGRQGVYGHAAKTFSERCRQRLRDWLLVRLEGRAIWDGAGIQSVASVSDRLRRDIEFMGVAEALTADPAFDVERLVDELVRQESVPFLPVLLYKPSGLKRREQWERTWDLQRQEDAGVNVGDIPVPPKYASADFQSAPFWRLRGKLDVPKERFISYPGCERAADGSLPIAWAGWDHAQQARALGAYYMQIKTEEGTVPGKLVPLLAGLLELLPWIRQWHAGTDPEFGLNLGDYYADFVDAEARSLGRTVDEVRAWKPEGRAKKGKRSKQT